MKKAVKISLWALGGLVGLVVLALLSLPLWIGPVAASVARSVVPSYTGCGFRLESFRLNPFTGSLRLVEAHLANPAAFKQPEAFGVSTVRVDVAVGSLFTSTIHVREVAIEGAFVGYYSVDGTNNFAAIAANVQEKMGPGEVETAKDEAEGGQKASKKVVIDRFRLVGTRVNLGMLPLTIPDLELTDIGKESGGATFAEVRDAVWQNIAKFFTGVGNAAAGLIKGTGAAAAGIVKGAGETATGLVQGAGETATGLVKGAVDGVGTASGKTTEALGKGVKDAAEGLRKLNPFGR